MSSCCFCSIVTTVPQRLYISWLVHPRTAISIKLTWPPTKKTTTVYRTKKFIHFIDDTFFSTLCCRWRIPWMISQFNFQCAQLPVTTVLFILDGLERIKRETFEDVTFHFSMLFLQSRMFYSTCEMSNVEVDNIFCIGFLHWDSKRVEWMKCESHKSLPCWWDGATQKSCMDFELKKPWISGIEPVRKKTYKLSIVFNPLNPNFKMQILICYPYTFSIEVVGRIFWSINKIHLVWSCP